MDLVCEALLRKAISWIALEKLQEAETDLDLIINNGTYTEGAR